jgi:hypothetical protein
MIYISILSTILALVFTVVVFNRYRSRGRFYLLLWAFGLLLYGIGTLSEVVMIFTFSDFALRAWYLSGALLTAAWLGQGTIHLLVRRRYVAPTLTVILGVISVVALVLVIRAPITAAAASYDLTQPISAQYDEILTREGLIRVLPPVLNIYGTVALIGGAVYSAYIFWRKRVLAGRMYGNILIAAGAFMPAMGGSLLKAGLADLLYVSEFLGVVLMYAGFLVATAEVPEEELEQQAEPAAL